MRRREFVKMLGAAAAMSPHTAWAQQPRKAHLGWLTTAPADDVNPFLDALRAGLAAQGYVEGRNIMISARYADGDISRVPALADELTGLPVDLIATQGTATRQLIKTSAIVPVIYVFSADPVLAGIAESLARPGRRMTGITLLSAEMNGKRLELLREIVPKIGRVAILASPTHAGEELERKNSIEMADKLGIAIQYHPTPTTEALRAAFVRMTAEPPQALVVFPDPITFSNRRPIVDFANGLKVPVISGWADFADNGAICTYGPKLVESYRRLAYYADRVLKGDNPAELPIERSTVFELVLNLKTARALDIQIPSSLVARADRVIE